MKVSPHFWLQEFVSKPVYQRWREKAVWFVDPRLIAGAEFIRMHFGKTVLINNWHAGGKFQYRGFREPDSTVGAPLSQHRFGRAIDFNVSGISDAEVRAEILKHQQQFIDVGFSTMEAGEDTPSWSHLDMRRLGPLGDKIGQLLIVKP